MTVLKQCFLVLKETTRISGRPRQSVKAEMRINRLLIFRKDLKPGINT